MHARAAVIEVTHLLVFDVKTHTREPVVDLSVMTDLQQPHQAPSSACKKGVCLLLQSEGGKTNSFHL